MRKKPRFTHVRGNLRGDVSGKRFSTHVGEGKVAGVAQELLSDGTGCSVTWVGHGTLLQDTVTGYQHRIASRSTITGYCHESLPRISAADQNHSGI